MSFVMHSTLSDPIIRFKFETSLFERKGVLLFKMKQDFPLAEQVFLSAGSRNGRTELFINPPLKRRRRSSATSADNKRNETLIMIA